MVIVASVVVMSHHTTAFENQFFRTRLSCIALLIGTTQTLPTQAGKNTFRRTLMCDSPYIEAL
jgi:hypothetical protein